MAQDFKNEGAFGELGGVGFGMILGFRIETTALSAAMGCLLLLVFALAMCWFSALIGVLLRSPQAVQGFGFLLMFPLVFGSNLLVPTATSASASSTNPSG